MTGWTDNRKALRHGNRSRLRGANPPIGELRYLAALRDGDGAKPLKSEQARERVSELLLRGFLSEQARERVSELLLRGFLSEQARERVSELLLRGFLCRGGANHDLLGDVVADGDAVHFGLHLHDAQVGHGLQ